MRKYNAELVALLRSMKYHQRKRVRAYDNRQRVNELSFLSIFFSSDFPDNRRSVLDQSYVFLAHPVSASLPAERIASFRHEIGTLF